MKHSLLLSSILLSLFMITAIGCDTDDDVDSGTPSGGGGGGQDPAPHFSCLINGEAFVVTDPDHISASSIVNENDVSVSVGAARFEDAIDEMSIGYFTADRSDISVGDTLFTASDASSKRMSGLVIFNVGTYDGVIAMTDNSDTTSNWMYLTEIDSVNSRWSGTFSFSGMGSDDLLYEVTEGVFTDVDF